MSGGCGERRLKHVALPTEGVDRNTRVAALIPVAAMSPSPRRAWIEILLRGMRWTSGTVALPTEGVDRNACHFWASS